VCRISPSPTLRITGLAIELRARGVDVVDLSVGEPDLPTPEVAKAAGKKAIDDNRTRYTSNPGVIELRRAVAAKIAGESGVTYSADEILISPGAKASLFFAAAALFYEGDEVVIPSPYWVSFPEQVRLAGATPVFVAASEGERFKLRPEALAAALTPSTKGLILNYPANPTGACYDRAELEAVAEVCIARDLVVIADEIYAKLVYDGRRFTSIAAVRPGMRDRTVVINGMSKAYCMTGWRIGYAAGPGEVIEAMASLQSHTTSNATSISQWASLAALGDDSEGDRDMVRRFESRRDETVRGIGSVPGMQCRAPEGAFYVFPNVSALLGRRAGDVAITTSEDLAVYLLERARVAVVPGEAFGAPGHIRISYAASTDRIREGIARIREAVSVLR
jgi:aspartate aminotransferase